MTDREEAAPGRDPSFVALRRWAPEAWSRMVSSFRWRRVLSLPPLGFCTRPFEDPDLGGPGHGRVVRFTYDPWEHGRRICLSFAAALPPRADMSRFLAVAAALWRLARSRPDVTYHDVHVDTSDCGDDTLPQHVLRFARGPGAPHRLIPNAYLLTRRKRLPAARPFSRKSDHLFFRGSATGHGSFDDNKRVVMCLVAKRIPRADCGLCSTAGMDAAFGERCRREGIVADRTPPAAMNAHRFLVDVDGYTSSWDRYLWTGHFGGVPIRFEPTWEECWHGHLIDGENVSLADRHTLPAVVELLRSRPRVAEAIAKAASSLAADLLSPQGAQRSFNAAWLAHLEGDPRRSP